MKTKRPKAVSVTDVPALNKPELLAPAGDFEKLQMAVSYGADAVYIGGKNFGLRANAKNFDDNELANAIKYAHDFGVKVYVTANIFAKNHDFNSLEKYLKFLREINTDAVLVADPGVLDIARGIKGLEIHISTQANVTNYQSAAFYQKNGASRVVLARELNFDEIEEINCRLPSLETEVFVHGAMCVAYSGRCLLSSYMVNRDGNRGNCAQPCRWKYRIQEEQSPGQYLPINEDESGTYIMNSKDLCLIQHIPRLVKSGVSSLKIEGRMKTSYYVAVVTRAYRQAIDDFFESPELYNSKLDYYLEEVKKTSHRDFYTGFYFGSPAPPEGQNYQDSGYTSTRDFLGVVQGYDKDSGYVTVQQRNKFSIGDEVEFVKADFKTVVKEMYDIDGNAISSAPHPKQVLKIKVDRFVGELDILRSRIT